MEDLIKLKEEVFNGEKTIFEVTDLTGKKSIDILGWGDISNLLTAPNAQLMVDLVTLYDGQQVVGCDDLRYRVIVGYKLIANLIENCAKNMNECVDDSVDAEEEYWQEYIKSKE